MSEGIGGDQRWDGGKLLQHQILKLAFNHGEDKLNAVKPRAVWHVEEQLDSAFCSQLVHTFALVNGGIVQQELEWRPTTDVAQLFNE